MTKQDNGICVCHGLEEKHPPPLGFPAVSCSFCKPIQHAPEAGSGVLGAGAWCNMDQVNNNNNNSPPVLYSPTSALQNACCGCTGAQLHASVSSSVRHRTNSASVQRMPLTGNGILNNSDVMFFSLLLFAAQMRCGLDPAAGSSVSLCFFLPTETWRRDRAPLRFKGDGTRCDRWPPGRRQQLSFFFTTVFVEESRRFYKAFRRAPPRVMTTEPEGGAASDLTNRSCAGETAATNHIC